MICEWTTIATTFSCSSPKLYLASIVPSKVMGAAVIVRTPGATAAAMMRRSCCLTAAIAIRRPASACGSAEAEAWAQVVVSNARVSRSTVACSEPMPILRGVAAAPSAMFS